METKKQIGRPSGKRKTKKIEVLIEPSIKQSFMDLMINEGKCASAEIGQWIREYIQEREKNT